VFNHKRIGIGLLTSSRCFSADQNNKSLDKLRNFLQYWKKWQTDFGLKKLFLPQQLVQGAHRIKKADSDQKRNFIIPASFETHHNFKQISILELLQLLEPEKKAFGFAIGGIIVSSLATMAIPAVFGNVIDALSGIQNQGVEATMAAIQLSALQMIGITMIGSVATFVRTSVLDIIGQRVSNRLRTQLFNNLIEQEMAFFDENRSGELASRLSTDVHEVAEHLVENGSLFLTASINGIISVGFLAMISPELTAVTLAVVPTLSLGAYFYGRYVKRLSRELLHLLAQSTQVAAEKFANIRTVRSFAAEEAEKKLYKGKVDASYGLAQKMAYSEGGYMACVEFVSDSTLLLAVWLGAGMVMTGNLSVGNLASYCMYAHELGTSTTDISEGISGTLRAQGSGARVFWLLERNPKLPKGGFVPSEPLKGLIDFRDVCFRYPTRPDTKVLDNFQLTIQPGEKIGITGNSGCGKSTVGALVQHFYEPDQGAVLIDGRDIGEYDSKWLANQIAVVSQEPTLFATSIAENIAYGRPHATMEDIEWAATQAHIHDFINSLPDQYQTYCGERGVSLSGGQKQRIAIARALLKNPQILILDEAISALDGENSQLVLEALSNLVVGRTTIVIAHHAKQLEQTDRVCVVDQGKVTELGSYHNLLNQEGSLLSRLLIGSKPKKS